MPKLVWPAWPWVSKFYGPLHPLGIDLGLVNYHASPVVAAAAGEVTFTGGNPCCSYGYYVVVDHGNGYSTLYGHLSSIAVSNGQEVKQGEKLGISGNTGKSTGEHLHFELRHDGEHLNPLLYLPRSEPPG